MNFLNNLFNTKERQEIDNPAKAIIYAIIKWKNFLPAMVDRDAKANGCSIDEFFSLLARRGESEKYIAKTHLDLLKDLISEPTVKEAIVNLRTVIINRLNITNDETKSYVHDVIFRRIIFLGEFSVSLPPLQEHYGNKINEKEATEIEEMVKLVLGLPGLNSNIS